MSLATYKMATTVNVLCPNGRRQNVKITPNTKMLQVLEDVCRKQGIDVEVHELRHGKNILDLTLPARYLNLPNNAKLEVAKSNKTRTESDVLIGLQLENGQRLQQSFNPASNIWDILTQFETKNDCLGQFACTKTNTEKSQVMHPVVVYMREEVVGEIALKRTKLRDLGLTSGKAILRLIYREFDESALTEINDQIVQQEAKRQKLENSAVAQANTSSSCSAAVATTKVAYSEPAPKPMAVQLPASNIQPSSRLNDAPFQRSIFPPTQEHSEQSAPVVHFAPSPQAVVRPEISEFKFPEETKGKAVYRNEYNEFKEEEYKPCDRNTVVYPLIGQQGALKQGATGSDDIPDDFFEVTEKDLRKLMADLQHKVRLMNEQPLLTEAMRQQSLEDKMAKYSHAVIRVQFPDKNILQGVFRPRETVRALYKYVQSSLVDNAMPFYLYTAPPKKELKDQAQLLIQANLVPAAVVFFGSPTKTEHYLASALLGSIKTVNEAEEVVRKYLFSDNDDNRGDYMPSVSASVRPKESKPVASNGAAAKTDNKGNSSGKVPKWFMTGRK